MELRLSCINSSIWCKTRLVLELDWSGVTVDADFLIPCILGPLAMALIMQGERVLVFHVFHEEGFQPSASTRFCETIENVKILSNS